ncbi:MAG: TrpB-like pyridoxal phosphate-dependent enzyme [Methanomassiliicoccales archaeon]
MKFLLDEEEIPKKWYNIQADLPTPLDPPMMPDGNPAGPKDLAPFFPLEILKQEMSQERWIPIPEEVRDIYRLWRPTPLYRAIRLERELKTPAKIYYKWEGVSPAGSHKPNTAVAQAYYNMKEGVERLTTETGAGQWGSALAFGTSFFNMDCRVYMVRISFDQKPYRRSLMETWGAECIPSPSNLTAFGRQMLEKYPDTPGSLGIAISEAMEEAMHNENTKYSLGSVLNHVLLHQTIIGLEAKRQFEQMEEYPDYVFGCVGGGSNFAGAAFPFAADKLNGGRKGTRIVGCEPTACPTLTKGPYMYDHGDTAKLTPMMMMYTLGHDFVPPPIHAGGLRYHGDAPLLCKLVKEKVIEATSFQQRECFDAAVTFARTEGFVIAPETSHCVKAAIDQALRCKETGEEKVIFFNNSGHGFLDMSSYDAYFAGRLEDYDLPEETIRESTSRIKGPGSS